MVGGGKMHSPKKRLSTTAVLLAGVALTTAGWLSARSVESTRQEPETKIRVETRLVLVDVVVTDKKGNPVRGLAKEDFALKENGKSQAITVFSWEGREKTEERPAPPPLAENVRTNGPDYHKPPGPLTVILVDTLNTARADQVRVRSELMHYLTEQFRPEDRVAILVMGDRTEVLQDFTSDPQLLLAALKKFAPKGSALLNLRESLISDDAELMKLALLASMLSDASPEQIEKAYETIDEMDNFDTNILALSDRERMRKTLEALGGIAQALLRYPGRKNLIWVSAAFPAFYSGDSYRRNQWAMGQELRRVSRLFSDARVSIYAVDPRGLDPAQDRENMRAFLPKRLTGELSPSMVGKNPVTATARNPREYLMNSLSAMKALAGNTGGKAFYNRNDLGNAVAEAAADGSAYYTLGYNPANKENDGKFRKIEVKLAKKGYKLRYRRGYYATEPEEESQVAESDTEAPTEGVSAPDERNLLQLRSALFHPLPPTGLTLYTQVSPPKQPGPASVMVQILVDAKTVTFRDAPGQSQRIDLDFVLAAFTPQGAQLKNSAERFRKTLNPAQHQKVMEGGMLYPMNLRLEPGRYVLRMLVRDNFSGKLGRVDTPLEVAAPEAN